jgi:hypothetical protein
MEALIQNETTDVLAEAVLLADIELLSEIELAQIGGGAGAFLL